MDTDEQILECIKEDFKTTSQIAEEINIFRNRVYVRLVHLHRRKEVIRLLGKKHSLSVEPDKYKAI